MYEKNFIAGAIGRSAETAVDRRKMLTIFGLAGAGAAAATIAGGGAANAADSTAPSVPTVLNFALNLEYLEAEFYLRAYTGHGLNSNDIEGTGKLGPVYGGHAVPFKSKALKRYAEEIAKDEEQHVRFLRHNLGSAAVARPQLSLNTAFTAAATAAGVIKKGQKFDAFASEENFLLAAFLFEDVGVTAYKGAAGFLTSAPVYLEAAAGILAVEAYHAGIVRSTLYAMAEETPALFQVVQKLSDARDSLDGSSDDDQGIWRTNQMAGLVPTDKNGIVYSRTPGQVLNIVYLNNKAVTKGGFYPNGVNGSINTSAAN